ncbi:MAG: undecaprenyl diphosphate synthase family protein, partial [Thermoanaerobaculia bacterium]
AGHRAGRDAVHRTIEAAPSLEIDVLTLYAFSGDNWQRPPAEVSLLMSLFRRTLDAERRRCRREGIRLRVIGRRDRLEPDLVDAIERTEAATADGTTMALRLAIDYSGRDAIVRAAEIAGATRIWGVGLEDEQAAAGRRPASFRRNDPQRRPASFRRNDPQRRPASVRKNDSAREIFRRCLAAAIHDDDTPDVDLLIRTGRELRISDFLLWEAAYAELWFTDRMWPDFSAADLTDAVHAYRGRIRRFGGLTTQESGKEAAHGEV